MLLLLFRKYKICSVSKAAAIAAVGGIDGSCAVEGNLWGVLSPSTAQLSSDRAERSMHCACSGSSGLVSGKTDGFTDERSNPNVH